MSESQPAPESAALAVLRLQLQSKSPMERLRAAESLARHGGEVAVEVLHELLQNPRADIRRRSASVLIRHERLRRPPPPPETSRHVADVRVPAEDGSNVVYVIPIFKPII